MANKQQIKDHIIDQIIDWLIANRADPYFNNDSFYKSIIKKISRR